MFIVPRLKWPTQEPPTGPLAMQSRVITTLPYWPIQRDKGFEHSLPIEAMALMNGMHRRYRRYRTMACNWVLSWGTSHWDEGQALTIVVGRNTTHNMYDEETVTWGLRSYLEWSPDHFGDRTPIVVGLGRTTDSMG